MRLFAAVELGAEALLALRTAVARVRKAAPDQSGLRWLDSSGWHLTLQFFGEVDAARVATLSEACTAAAGTSAPFTLTLAGLGAFPRPERARVVWVGVQRGATELEALARALWAHTGDLGFEPEARVFRPHVTLARARKPARVIELLDAHPPAAIDSVVAGITLFRSHLDRSGARYEALHHAPLSG